MFSTNRVKTACFILLVILVLLLVYASATNRKSGGVEGKYHGGADCIGFTHELLPAGKVPHGHCIKLDPAGEGTSTIEKGHSHEFQDRKDTGKGPRGLTHHRHGTRVIPAAEDITKFVVPVGEE